LRAGRCETEANATAFAAAPQLHLAQNHFVGLSHNPNVAAVVVVGKLNDAVVAVRVSGSTVAAASGAQGPPLR